MIQELKDTPNTMVGFQVGDRITRHEFDRVLLPAAHELILRTGKLNYLFLLDPTVVNYEFGIWLEDFMIETNTALRSRAAIAIPDGYSSFLKCVLQRVIPGYVKIFSESDLDRAILWASGQMSFSSLKIVYQQEDDKRD